MCQWHGQDVTGCDRGNKDCDGISVTVTSKVGSLCHMTPRLGQPLCTHKGVDAAGGICWGILHGATHQLPWTIKILVLPVL